MTDELYISDFAYGFLYAESRRAFVEAPAQGETDYWQSFKDVPSDASEHREYEDYDLNFRYDEDEDRWHCRAYATEYDDDDNRRTNMNEWRLLW